LTSTATRGPWFQNPGHPTVWTESRDGYFICRTTGEGKLPTSKNKDTASYIAHMDPSTTERFCDTIDELRTEIKSLKNNHGNME
jgi:hypothetical protein